MIAQPFRLGQRVEFQCLTGKRMFRGEIIAFLDDPEGSRSYAVVRDETGLKPRIVRTNRLAHPGGLKAA